MMMLMANTSFIIDGFIIYSLAYLLLKPDYLCVENGIISKCDIGKTCLSQFITRSDGVSDGYLVDMESSTSLNNWIEYMDLRCAPGWVIGFFGSAYFIGVVTGTLLLSRYGDIVGRIRMLRLALSFTALIYGLIVFLAKSAYFT
jgi:MFS family permease